ncbi:hypothetical protein EJB05_05923, partial [Eragrostis curvula]
MPTTVNNGQVPQATNEKGSFWWKDIMKFCDHYRGNASEKVGKGDTLLLWEDVWDGHFLKNELPRLPSFSRSNKTSVLQYVINTDPHHLFHTPLSQEVMQELTTLNSIINQVQQRQNEKDVWIFNCGTSYILQENSTIWLSNPSIRHNLSNGSREQKLNSRNLLKRKNYKVDGDDYTCVLCNHNIEEYTYHLFVMCPFMSTVGIFLGSRGTTLHFFQTLQRARENCQHNFFMEIFTIAVWEIWKQQNGKIFRGAIPSIQAWKTSFVGTVNRQIYRLKEEDQQLVKDWLQNLLVTIHLSMHKKK